MTLQINMLPNASVNGGTGLGIMTAAGNPWTVSDAFAQELVNRGVATGVNWGSTVKTLLYGSIDPLTGMVVGLAGVPLTIPAQIVGTVIYGDSMTVNNASIPISITSVTRTNNVATAVCSGYVLGNGCLGTVGNMLDASFNANNVVFTYISSTSFSYPSVGANGLTSDLSANSPMFCMSAEAQNDHGYFAWLNAKSKGAFRLLHNGGRNGQNSGQMLARFSADCLAFTPKAKQLIFLCGYNDFAVFGMTAAQVYANVTAMAALATAAGMRVAIISALPWTTGGTTANRQQAVMYNRMIRLYCEGTPNVRYIDAASYLVTATSTTYTPINGMLNTDGIHPSSRSAERIGQALWDVLQYETPVPKRLINSIMDTPANTPGCQQVLNNAPWVATGGLISGSGCSGVAPTGFNITNSGSGLTVGSAPARADGIGFDCQAVFTSAVYGDTCIISYTGYMGAGLTAGQTVEFLADFSATGVLAANLAGINASITWNDSINTGQGIFSSTNTAGGGTTGYVQSDFAITLASYPLTVPPGATGFALYITATGAGVGTALTMKIGRNSCEIVNRSLF